MNTLFLMICTVSVLFFFVAILWECSRPLAEGKKPSVIRRSTEAAVVDSATGRRLFAHLEQQMAEFLAVHHRTVTLLLVAVALFVMVMPAHAQRTQPTPPPPSETEPAIPPAVQKQLDAMQKRIDQLEAELAARPTPEVPSHMVAEQTAGAQAPAAEGAMQMAAKPGKPAKPEPFSFADFTWLNGNSRIKEVPFQNAFFTPEIRADVNYIYDFAHPQDDTIGGSSEIFRPTNSR